MEQNAAGSEKLKSFSRSGQRGRNGASGFKCSLCVERDVAPEVNSLRAATFSRSMRDAKKDRVDRRERHAAEIEASQKSLRESISETERLVGESDKMLRRHRQERDAEE